MLCSNQKKEKKRKEKKNIPQEIITEGFRRLIHEIPQTSPIRRNLIRTVCHRLPHVSVARTLEISRSTVERSFKDFPEKDLLKEIKYPMGVSKPKRPESDEYKDVINEILPIVSGRKYRLKKESWKKNL
jgi:hypothetical protein